MTQLASKRLVTESAAASFARKGYGNSGPDASTTLDLTQVVGCAGTLATIPTGFTGNDIVEPAMLYDESAPFLGYEYVLAANPYYQSNDLYENPCLWVSHDALTWIPVVNGVVTPGYGGAATPVVPANSQGDGHLSDAFIVRGPDGRYTILYNQSLVATGSGGTGTGGNTWSIKGVSAATLAGPWSTPVTIVASVLATNRPSSPSMFWDGNTWHMYVVDLANTSATKIQHYKNPSIDPLAGTWTKQTDPTIALPTGYTGQVWWHLNAYRWGRKHVLLVQDTTAGTSAGGNLWLLTSDDQGATWTVPTKPFMQGGQFYRSAAVITRTTTGLGLEILYGLLGTNWQLFRTVLRLGERQRYGGASANGIPINAQTVQLAKVPVSPYLFGDTATRADSASSPGTADSGTAWSVDSGTFGISSNAIYAVSTGNIKAAIAGLADAVYTCEFKTIDTANQQWFIVRWIDSSNYIRVGAASPGYYYSIQTVVAGSVTSTVALPIKATSGDVVAVVCNGTTVDVYVNGSYVGSMTGVANTTGSGIGLRLTGGSTTRVRNLTARPLVNGA